jgi:cytochrome c556
MMTRLLSISVLPLQQTVASTAPNTLQVAAEVSTVVIAVMSVLLLVVTLLFLVQLKRLLGSVQQHVQPVTDRARVAAENVEYITALVRQDVQKVRASVSGLSDRLGEASERMEERVEEFNALMDVVQDEAESVLLDTAAIVRGVRAGAQTMGGSVAASAPGGDAPERASVEGADDSEAEDEVDGVDEAMAGEAPERA